LARPHQIRRRLNVRALLSTIQCSALIVTAEFIGAVIISAAFNSPSLLEFSFFVLSVYLTIRFSKALAKSTAA